MLEKILFFISILLFTFIFIYFIEKQKPMDMKELEDMVEEELLEKHKN